MLDVETLRITLGAISLTVLVLFYLGVYRPTRSSFSGWWTASLLCSGMASSLLLLNGTSAQVVANSAANALQVTGVTCVWFATRSLRRRALPVWVLAVAVTGMLVATALDDPGRNAWAANGVLFVYMAAMFVAGAREVWIVWWRRRGLAQEERNGEAVVALLVSALAASALGAFYAVRSVLFLTVGHEDPTFETFVGTGPTTVILLLSLVAVTFSVSAIGWDQQTRELRRRAMRDDLTGLFGRGEFLRRAERAAASIPGAALVVADLDHFKAVNDAHGHVAGDRALLEFAAAIGEALAPGELAGRLGGEEFGIVLAGGSSPGVRDRLAGISEAFAARSSTADFAMPTVSYGVSELGGEVTLSQAYERADLALYRAKDAGRDTVMVDSDGEAERD